MSSRSNGYNVLGSTHTVHRGPTTGNMCVCARVCGGWCKSSLAEEALWQAGEGTHTLPADTHIHFLNDVLDKYKLFMDLDSAQRQSV